MGIDQQKAQQRALANIGNQIVSTVSSKVIQVDRKLNGDTHSSFQQSILLKSEDLTFVEPKVVEQQRIDGQMYLLLAVDKYSFYQQYQDRINYGIAQLDSGLKDLVTLDGIAALLKLAELEHQATAVSHNQRILASQARIDDGERLQLLRKQLASQQNNYSVALIATGVPAPLVSSLNLALAQSGLSQRAHAPHQYLLLLESKSRFGKRQQQTVAQLQLDLRLKDKDALHLPGIHVPLKYNGIGGDRNAALEDAYANAEINLTTELVNQLQQL
ncbi:hypothetical protein [Ferrimonas lipolytica]|uniref:Uncharacterized protein n=1 Tax=Ferrimonas lipolytica TaxID=2724191 RepID=A0A6H1UIC4_9GAMM|nr:hypothetical protein [Ferrimonas lipolytica]QIZ78379.1 hypothetical protein HER31_16605 [Ferrimonas lipolytica]